MYKLGVYIPATHLDAVKEALFASGAGRYRHYDRCCWQTLGDGEFRPLEGSRPHLGKQNEVESVPEYYVEMICDEKQLPDIREALLKAHPYEEPAYHFFRIET
jgi:hypothetical protein